MTVREVMRSVLGERSRVLFLACRIGRSVANIFFGNVLGKKLRAWTQWYEDGPYKRVTRYNAKNKNIYLI